MPTVCKHGVLDGIFGNCPQCETDRELKDALERIAELEAENRVLRNNTSKSVMRRLEAQRGIGCGLNKFPDNDYMPTDEGDK